MKAFRQFCAASVLTLTLGLPTFAGEMSTTVAQPSPPPNATTAGQTSITAADSGEASTIGSVTETALSLLQSVLSLL